MEKVQKRVTKCVKGINGKKVPRKATYLGTDNIEEMQN